MSVMHQQDWLMLLDHLKSIGLAIASQDIQTGLITVKVSPLPNRSTPLTG